ncbi:MAG: rhomboid family intramembrane serine protease [Deltaproteobacteria bacterium]|nr:rhomboid family intramembrane serine protease [Deltaproteobacteria bacterium]MBW2555230.1 rhomboid family intramembrane serine protease [Deltaproteobacteria bacterium]MCK5010118.1 rhomboid family intramembrane serine protease [Deltaproteobacteria bacterium]
MSIQYNAPAILTFTLISTAILFLDQLLGSALTQRFFAVYSTFNSASFLDYFRFFTHIFGHKNWTHLMGNFSFILLVGHIVEEKYQSGPLK